MSSSSQTTLSIIITSVEGPPALSKCLSQLVPQMSGKSIEVIVPHESNRKSIELLKEKYYQIQFIDIGKIQTSARYGSPAAAHEIYDRSKSAGLSKAKGDVLALLDDQGTPDPDWCDQVIEAHKLPYGVIGGAIEHSGSGILNWAVYFQDFGRYQLPLHEGHSEYLSDINISYKRETLESVKELWIERFNEATVNWALAKKGEVLWQRPQMVVRLDRGKLNYRDLIKERYAWGRLFGYTRAGNLSSKQRFVYAIASIFLPFILIFRIAKKAFIGKRTWSIFLRASAATALLTLSWCFGEFMGYLTLREAS